MPIPPELPSSERKFNERQLKIIGFKERGAIEIYGKILAALPPESQHAAQQVFTKFFTRDQDYVDRNMNDDNVKYA